MFISISRQSWSWIMQYVIHQPCSRFATSTTRSVSALGIRQLHCSKMVKSLEKIRKQEEHEQNLSSSRRQLRKRRPVTSQLVKSVREPEVVAIALSESFDLPGVFTDPSIANMFHVSFVDDDPRPCCKQIPPRLTQCIAADGVETLPESKRYLFAARSRVWEAENICIGYSSFYKRNQGANSEDTIHLVKKLEYSINLAQINEIFVFQDGVAVFWNIDHAQRAYTIRDLERYMEGPYESSITIEEQDTMPYTVIDGSETLIKHDCFILNGEKHGADHRRFEHVLERFSLSQAFAASVKVGVWETLLNNLAEPLSETTKALKQGIIPWSRRKALMKSGEFAALRHSINLDCTLLNHDFYWDRSEVEQYYLMSARHFTLGRRISGLNRRLDYCEQLVKMVDNMLALRHASFLEWMIIVLIVIEVIFDLIHYADTSPTKVIVVRETADPAESHNASS